MEIDGKGYSITNLTVENDGYAAFIGKMAFSGILNIHDLTIKNSTFTEPTSADGESVCASFLGWKTEAGQLFLTNCVAENNIINSTKYIGGLVGYISALDGESYATTISGCSVKGCTLNSFYTEDGGSTYAGHCGGIAGYINMRTTVTRCTVEGVTILAGDNGPKSNRQGALVGSVATASTNLSDNTIKNTTIKGTTVTDSQLVGQVNNATLSGNTITND